MSGGRVRRLVAAGAPVLAAAVLTLGPAAGPASALNLGALTVPAGFTQGRVLVLRPDRIDLALDGRVVRTVAHTGALDLAALPDLVGDRGYVSRGAQGNVLLAVPLLERPGTSVVGAAPRLRRLLLDPGAALVGSHAGLTLTGVSVGPSHRGGGGYLAFGAGSSVRLRRVALAGLGAAGAGARAHATLRVSDGSLRILGASIAASAGDGLLVDGGTDLALTGLTVTGSRGVGVRLIGPVGADALPGPFTLSGNAGGGLAVRGADGLTVSGITSAHNRGPSVVLRGTQDVTVRGVTSTADATAVAVESSSGIHLTQVRADAAGLGVTVQASHGVRLDQVRISSATQTGMELSGQDVAVTDSAVEASREGLLLDGESQGVAVSTTTFTGTRDAARIGAQVSGARLTDVTLAAPSGVALRTSGAGTTLSACTLTGVQGIVVRDRADRLVLDRTSVVADGTALDLGTGTGVATVTGGRLTGRGAAAVVVDATRLSLRGTVVVGGGTGIVVHSAVVATGVEVNATDTGLRVGATAVASLTDGSVSAGSTGVEAAPGGSVTMTETAVRAARPSEGAVTFLGDNHWSHLPVRWLGIAVVVAVVAAIGLEIVRKVRDRSVVNHGQAPIHVLNRN